MNPEIRPVRETDAPECARILFEAFRNVAERHGFPPAFPSIEIAGRVVGYMVNNPRWSCLVAEADHLSCLTHIPLSWQS